jgi:hypothetical protein
MDISAGDGSSCSPPSCDTGDGGGIGGSSRSALTWANSYSPMPGPLSGELKVDPSIRLLAKRFGLKLDFFYGSQETDNAEYGQCRSASVRARVLSSTSANVVSIVAGNFVQQVFSMVGTAGGITTYTAASNSGTTTTLSYSTSANQFTQYWNNGMQRDAVDL